MKKGISLTESDLMNEMSLALLSVGLTFNAMAKDEKDEQKRRYLFDCCDHCITLSIKGKPNSEGKTH